MKFKGIKLFFRKDNRWQARFKKDNKIYYVYDKNQMNCYKKLKEKIKQLDNKKEISSKITLKEWIYKWLEIYKINKNRESTLKTFYSSYKNHFEKTNLINLELNQIKNIDIQEFLNNIQTGKMKVRCYEYLKDIFSKALNNELIKNNPLDKIEKPKYEKQRLNKALTKEQQKIFVNACFKSKFGDIYQTILFQGLRKGEAIALKRNDIDFDNKTLRIDESYISQNQKDKDTKNKSSKRVMPLFKNTEQILLKYKNLDENKNIFKTNVKELHNEFKKILKNNNLPDITIHELRHTFITRCKEAGIIENVVQLWCGHTLGSKMTSQVYTHINNEYNNECIEKFNKFDTPFDTP